MEKSLKKTKSSLIKDRNKYIILFYIVCLLFMISASLNDEMSINASLLFALIIGLIVVYFCTTDLKLQNKSLTDIQKILIFFTWPFALPVYLIITRKLRGVGIILLYNAMLIVMAFLVSLITLLAT
jgi:xanthine/uracil permease